MSRFVVGFQILIFAAMAPATAIAQDSAVQRDSAGSAGRSACMCPKAGVWRVKNLDGWMECNVLNIKRKLKGSDKNDGAIWILNDDCSRIFSEAYEREREDVLMDRVEANCNFFGLTPGEEDGAKVIYDMAYKVENEEFITGEAYLDMSGMGTKCEGYRPFEITYLSL